MKSHWLAKKIWERKLDSLLRVCLGQDLNILGIRVNNQITGIISPM